MTNDNNNLKAKTAKRKVKLRKRISNDGYRIFNIFYQISCNMTKKQNKNDYSIDRAKGDN